METTTLKNGSKEITSLVVATMLILEKLLQNEPIGFYEFVTKCRDKNHQYFGDWGERLQKDFPGLFTEGGRTHDSIRNITLNAVSGTGFNMVLSDPRK